MKVIPTFYNGILFRSRTEARWAVYFDQMKIPYRYELEGFELSNGQKYLPDFYLPDHGVYAEVKPFPQDDPRWHMFVKESGKSLVLLVGRVHGKAKPILSYDEYDNEVYQDEGHIVPRGAKYFPIFQGDWQDEQDTTAVDQANSARFEFGQSGAVL